MAQKKAAGNSMAKGLKPSQERFFDNFRTGLFKYLCLAGTTGSGKSFVGLSLLHLLCRRIPNLRFAVIRKTERNLKLTSIPTYKKVKSATRTVNDSVVVDMTARYTNGSEILFIWADISKDPDLDNVKGLELTGALIEEANQIDKKYFSILKTRIGRWNNEKCKSFIMLNLNPSLGWVKDMFYDPFIADALPENHYFQEFDINDAEDCSGKDYVDTINELPEEEHKRYVLNRWEYLDIPNQLIRYEWYKNCAIPEDEEPDIDPLQRSLLAIDPAWEGKDETGFGMMNGNHIGWFEVYPKQDPDFSGILGYNKSLEYKIEEDDVIVDPIGVGASTVLKMRNDLDFYPDLFIGGGETIDIGGFLKCFNKRAEAHWLLREAMRNEEVTITHSPSTQKQILSATYSVSDKKIKITDKKIIAKDAGQSPTILDLSSMLTHKYKTTNPEITDKLFKNQLKAQNKGNAMTRAQRERNAIIKINRLG